MNKELSPLEAFENIKSEFLYQLKERTGDNGELFENDLTIIETALKKLEKPKEIVGTTTVDKALEQFLIDSCPEVAKKLKALEIIKGSFHIDFDDISKTISLKMNKYQCCDYSIIFCETQEEYDSLKEALL